MLIKSLVSILLCLAMSAGYISSELSSDEIIYPDGLPSAETAAAAGLSLDVKSAILVESVTGRVLYDENAYAPRAIASITKIMTMLLVMEALEEGKITLDDVVVTSEHAYSMGGSQIWLEPGEAMTVHELLKAVAVVSANDASVALAEHVSGSEDEFVALMNRRAAELGMEKTVFKNSNGLDEIGHLSCAYDVALMSRELLKHDLIRDYITIWTDELRGGETFLSNTNKLLRTFNGTTGIKTGTTDDAGVCVSASAIRDGMELIAVVLGSSSGQTRFDAAKKLLSFGFSNYEISELSKSDYPCDPIKVRFGLADYCTAEFELPELVIVEKGKAELVHCELVLETELEAPVLVGQTVGQFAVYCEDELLYSCPVTASCEVERIDFWSALGLLFSSLISM